MRYVSRGNLVLSLALCYSLINMKKIIFCLLLQSSYGFAYMAYHSSEAALTFRAYVEVNSKVPLSESKVNEVLHDHELYLWGPMSYNPVLAAPKGDGKFSEKKIEKIKNGYRIHYTYNGTIVLQNGPRTHYPVVLPVNPEALWRKTSAKKKNPCTDPEDQGEEDFSYFWSPTLPGCDRLIHEGDDYYTIDAKIERLPNTEHTRPNYEAMPDKNGDIQIFLLMGLDDSSMGRNPIESASTPKYDDLNAKNFRAIRRQLQSLGFESRELSHAEIRDVIPVDTRPLPYVEELVQEYNNDRARRIVITMFFGKTDIGEASLGFNYYLKHAMETGAVTIYDGHSGLGTNLVIPVLERRMKVKFNLPKDRYQIFYANSCSSYAYYNASFFQRKSNKNLNVITAGAPTPFDGGVETDMSMLEAVHNWVYRGTKLGYRTLMQRLENDNLAGVNGDEENPLTTE